MKNTNHSKHTTDINIKAWKIRRNAAKRFNCKVMEISWKECLIEAKANSLHHLDKLTRAYTASSSFEDLLTVNDNYNPTLQTKRFPALLPLAIAFDKYMQAFGKPNRIYRSGDGGFPVEMKERIKAETLKRKQDNYKKIIQNARY